MWFLFADWINIFLSKAHLLPKSMWNPNHQVIFMLAQLSFNLGIKWWWHDKQPALALLSHLLLFKHQNFSCFLEAVLVPKLLFDQATMMEWNPHLFVLHDIIRRESHLGTCKGRGLFMKEYHGLARGQHGNDHVRYCACCNFECVVCRAWGRERLQEWCPQGAQAKNPPVQMMQFFDFSRDAATPWPKQWSSWINVG